ncbi:MAG: hypothetical protein OCD03_02840 [Hyphomicrobiales bacterium]
MSDGTLRIGTSEAGVNLELSQLKMNLGVTHDLDDLKIEGFLASAIALLENDYGICILRTVCMMVFADFGKRMVLKRANNMELLAINYFDADGTSQSFDIAKVRFAQDVPSFENMSLRDGFSWPQHFGKFGEITVIYNAGYQEGEDELWLLCIEQALKLIVGLWYKESAAALKPKLNELPMGVESLMRRFKSI